MSPIHSPYPFCIILIKQWLLVAGAVSLFAGGLYAGYWTGSGWTGPWYRANAPLQTLVLEKLKAELSLTPEQTEQLTPIITEACSRLRLLAEERHAERLSIYDEVCAAIAPDLTQQQQQKLEAMQEDIQHKQSTKPEQRIVAMY